MGGGEYARDVSAPPEAKLYRVGHGEQFERINQAYEQWKQDNAAGGQPEAVIEIAHSNAYQEQIELAVAAGERLELRAADGARPVLRLLDWYSNRPDALQIRGIERQGEPGSTPVAPLGRVVLDELLITGRGVSVTGPVGSVVIGTHAGAGLVAGPGCQPTPPGRAERGAGAHRLPGISRSILGTILVIADEVTADPLPIHRRQRLDATASDRSAVRPRLRVRVRGAARLSHTVISEIYTHAVDVAKNSIFDRCVQVIDAVRDHEFCYVPPRSRTPVLPLPARSGQAGLRDGQRGDLADPPT
jgi:hypothetical protein